MNKTKLVSAVVTPFDDHDCIDFDVLQELIERMRDYHDGFLIGGSTGEGDSLSIDEVQKLINFYREYDFIKIINISADCTSKTVSYIKSLKIPLNFTILLRVPAYYLASQNGMIDHFVTTFNAFPQYNFMIYDIPKRTGSILYIKSIRQIKEASPNFIGIKDCTNDFARVRELSSFIEVFGGNDENAVEYLRAGAHGLISVFSVVEKEYFTGIIAKKILEKPHCFSMDMGNPASIKYLLREKGFKSMNLRLPLKF